MKKNILIVFSILFLFQFSISQVPKEIILNTTGYGFDSSPGAAPHYNAQWDYIQKFANLTYNGQDASVTCVRFYINWESYEPTLGNYKRAELVQAIQGIVNLKGGTMKVALHFPYSRPGTWNDSYFADSSISRIYDGTYVRDNVGITCPSIYSEFGRNRFYAFVNDALAQLTSFYNKILFVKAGCTSAEEFTMPHLSVNGIVYPGMHDENAARSWRKEYLPCRYPGQSSVTWDGNTYSIANAPLGAQGTWPSWSNDIGKEFHRFAGWGLMRFYKGFRDVVKSHSNNLKVIYYVSDFGSVQGSTTHLHNSILPMAMNEFDGIYTTEADLDNIQEKIMALDVLKGTNPNKLAVIEFDPTDLGEKYAGAEHILPGVAETWMPRAYKHGADYVMLAMHYHDPAISTVAPALALVRANYVNGTYQSPSRQTPVNVNTAPNVFLGNHLFMGTWRDQLNGNNWSVTDNNPVSISMTDNNYWENIWSCNPSNPCDYNITASGPGTVAPNASVTLNTSCTRQCSGVGYSWSGNGISGNNSSITFNAPSTTGTYTYTITASKSGCTNKTATVNVVVAQSGQCNFTEKGQVGTWAGHQVQTRQFTINGQLKWAIVVKVDTPNTDRHFVRGDNFADRTDITWINGPIAKSCLGAGETGWGGLGFPSGVTVPAGYEQGTMPDGAVYFQQTGTPPPSCDFNLAASASNTNPPGGSSVTLSSSCMGANCSGIAYAWSGNGISGSNTSVTFNAPSTAGTYTYTITGSKSGCSNKTANVTLTVGSGPGTNCNTILSDVNGANCLFIEGWVYDYSNPNSPVYIDIYDGSNLVVSNYAANKFRQDLLNAGFGNGEHAFEIPTPVSLRDGQSHTLTFKVRGCNYELNNSPKAISGCGNNLVLDPGDQGNTGMVGNKPQLTISPNPSKGIFDASFYVEKGKKATILINDLQGKIIYMKNITGQGMHREKINLNNKASGSLFLRLVNGNKTEMKKINIVR